MGIFDLFKDNKKIITYPKTSAIIAAAGNGSRMSGVCEDKLFLSFGEKEVIAHTLDAFENAETITEIVVVTSENNIVQIGDLVNGYGFKKVKCVVKGGKTRQISVGIGLENISEDAEYISVADGARPFIKTSVINFVNFKAYTYMAAAACVKVIDTIKQIDEEGLIAKTVDRSKLLAVQTPQSFKKDIYLEAIEKANRMNYDFTDDCQLMELMGRKIYPVMSDYYNIKITTPEDVAFAKAIFESKIE